jgi:Flp pilus assembly protein TadG
MSISSVARKVMTALAFPPTTGLRNLRRGHSLLLARSPAAGPALRVTRRAGQSERGQALIEFALILPFFLVLLIVMVDFGIAVDHRLVMQHAVSEGVREAAVTGGSSASALTDIQNTVANQSQNLVSASAVSACYINKTGTSDPGEVGDQVQVQATYTYQFSVAKELLGVFGIAPAGIAMTPVYATALQIPVTGANTC